MSTEPDKKTRTTTSQHLARRMLSWSSKVGRLAVYFLFVGVILGAVALRIAYAKAKRVALETGEELVRLTEAGQMSGVYRLRLNGEIVKITSATSDMAPAALLDRFQKACETHADGLSKDFENLREAIKSTGKVSEVGHPGVGVLRQSDDDGGVVVCFATNTPSDEKAIYSRIAEFAETGDLASIGQVRYVMVKRARGAESHVVALWNDGSLSVKKMFPDQGDAPGSDMPGVLRPPSARRLLTAHAEGAPYGLRVYESTMKAEQMLAEYDATMTKLGWQGYPGAVEAAPNSRAYSKDGVDVIVTAENQKDHTLVSLVEMAAR